MLSNASGHSSVIGRECCSHWRERSTVERRDPCSEPIRTPRRRVWRSDATLGPEIEADGLHLIFDTSDLDDFLCEIPQLGLWMEGEACTRRHTRDCQAPRRRMPGPVLYCILQLGRPGLTPKASLCPSFFFELSADTLFFFTANVPSLPPMCVKRPSDMVFATISSCLLPHVRTCGWARVV